MCGGGSCGSISQYIPDSTPQSYLRCTEGTGFNLHSQYQIIPSVSTSSTILSLVLIVLQIFFLTRINLITSKQNHNAFLNRLDIRNAPLPNQRPDHRHRSPIHHPPRRRVQRNNPNRGLHSERLRCFHRIWCDAWCWISRLLGNGRRELLLRSW